jgi:hypothetical protein
MNIRAPLNTPDVIDLDSSSNSTDAQQVASSSNSSSSSCSSTPHLLNQCRISQSFSKETISANLKNNKNEWSVIDVKNKKSDCWKCFGIPARTNNEKK